MGVWFGLFYASFFPIGFGTLGACVPQHLFGRATPTTILRFGVVLYCVYCALIDELLQALLAAYNLSSLGAREGDSVLTECAEDVGRKFVECHSQEVLRVDYAVRVTVIVPASRLV